MLDNQFQFAIMATEDRVRALRGQKDSSGRSAKRVFRLPGNRAPRLAAGQR